MAQPTLNIEIDYMVLRDSQQAVVHSHKPKPDEIAAVVQMFACHGIVVNILVDQEIPHQNVICPDPNGQQGLFNYTGTGGFGAIKNTNFNHSGEADWHYCVFAHNYSTSAADCAPSGSSGVAEVGGNYLIVSLGSFSNSIGTPFDRAATLAHEFGHNLGLLHCGEPQCDANDNYKPNFPSIMNYRFQLNGVRAQLEFAGMAPALLNFFKNIDYSGGNMCFLQESGLNEVFGSGMKSVDWDCNGSIGGTVSANLNGGADSSWCNGAGGLTGLTDYNEWDAVWNRVNKIASIPQDTTRLFPIQTCITWEESRKYAKAGQLQPPLIVEACAPAQMIYLKSTALFSGAGSCTAPYHNLSDAIGPFGVPAGSILYFAEGVYFETASPLVITKPMKFTAAGSAIIIVTPKARDTEKSSE